MTFLHRIQARDRALYQALLLSACGRERTRTLFTALTHVGGARVTIAAAMVPLVTEAGGRTVGRNAVLTLVVSHLIVQLAKRLVGRARPSCAGIGHIFVAEPDRFSFPSGHATASLAVALAYGAAFPGLAVPLVVLAALVGISRVVLGVHYPGDVAAGQAIAVATHVLLRYAGS